MQPHQGSNREDEAADVMMYVCCRLSAKSKVQRMEFALLQTGKYGIKESIVTVTYEAQTDVS